MKSVVAILFLILCLPVKADCLSASRLQGVNLAGAEFNSSKIPGVMFKNYTYPSTTTLDYFRGKGANLIRLPILWERYQPEAYGDLDTANMTQLRKIVAYAKQYDMCIWIDLHNYARYLSLPLSDYSDPDALLYDFWRRIDEALGDDSQYWAYGLMNEPAKVTRQVWADIATSVAKQLRNGGATGLIIVPGGNWSGAHSWLKSSSTDPSNAELFANLEDPLGRMVFEVHQYADSSYSGTKTDCISVEKMQILLQRVTDWAAENNKQMIMGEFGVDGSDACLKVLDSMLSSMQSKEWRGWSYWAAGAWWGSYPFSIQPSNGEDKPQMAVLSPYLQ